MNLVLKDLNNKTIYRYESFDFENPGVAEKEFNLLLENNLYLKELLCFELSNRFGFLPEDIELIPDFQQQVISIKSRGINFFILTLEQPIF